MHDISNVYAVRPNSLGGDLLKTSIAALEERTQVLGLMNKLESVSVDSSVMTVLLMMS